MIFVVTPEQMGLYAGAMLVLTFVQMIGEIAIRQSAAALWRIEGGPTAIRRLSLIAAAATGLAVLGYASYTWAVGAADGAEATALACLSAAGVASGLSAPRATYAQ